MYKYIINPKTNKKVNINSRLGKKILYKFIVMIGGMPELPTRSYTAPERIETEIDLLSDETTISPFLPFEPTETEVPVTKQTLIPQLTPQKISPIGTDDEPLNNIIGATCLHYFYLNIPGQKKKKIIMLGETHTPIPNIPFNKFNLSNGSTIFYDQFIINILNKLKSKNICLDFLVEDQFNENQKKKYKEKEGGATKDERYITTYKINKDGTEIIHDSYSFGNTLNYIWDLFKDCSNKEYNSSKNESCTILNIEYNNLRYHNLDLRHLDHWIAWMVDPPSQCVGTDYCMVDSETEIAYRYRESFNQHPDLLDLTMKYILNYCPYNASFEEESFLKDLIIIFDEKMKPDIQQRHVWGMPLIEDNEIKKKHFLKIIKKIRFFITKEFIKFENNKFINITSHQLKKILYDTYSKIDIFDNALYNLVLLSMDVYFWCRFLKNFETNTTEKQDRGPLNCRNKSNMDKILVYAGIVHVNLYKDILEKIFISPDVGTLEYVFIVEGEDDHTMSDDPLITGGIKKNKNLFFENSQKNTANFSNFSDLVNDFIND